MKVKTDILEDFFGTLKDPKFNTPLKVLNLTRISIGSFDLNIESGKWRYLTQEEEINLLKNLR